VPQNAVLVEQCLRGGDQFCLLGLEVRDVDKEKSESPERGSSRAGAVRSSRGTPMGPRMR